MVVAARFRDQWFDVTILPQLHVFVGQQARV
jgi:hypothetical protein